MEQIKPLAKFPLIATNSVAEAEFAISRSLTDVSISRAVDRNRFQLQMNGVNIGRTSLVFNRFGTDTKVNAGLPGDSVHFIIGGSAPTSINLDKGSVVVSPQKAAMVMPARLKQIERSESSEAFILQTSQSELLHHFRETGRMAPSRFSRLRLQHRLDYRPRGHVAPDDELLVL